MTLQFGSSGANADGSNLSPGDVSLSIGPSGGGAVAAVTVGSGRTFDVDAGRAAPSVKATAVTTSTGYTIEAAVPWSVIQLPEAGGLSTMYAGASSARTSSPTTRTPRRAARPGSGRGSATTGTSSTTPDRDGATGGTGDC